MRGNEISLGREGGDGRGPRGTAAGGKAGGLCPGGPGRRGCGWSHPLWKRPDDRTDGGVQPGGGDAHLPKGSLSAHSWRPRRHPRGRKEWQVWWCGAGTEADREASEQNGDPEAGLLRVDRSTRLNHVTSRCCRTVAERHFKIWGCDIGHPFRKERTRGPCLCLRRQLIPGDL